MAVPYTFATATTSIPLSNLDSNFATPITLGNTSVYLGNTTTSIGNLTLTNTTISSVATTFPNSFLANSSITLGTTNVSLGGTASSLANVTLSNVTVSSGNVTTSSITDSGLTSGRVTYAGTGGLLQDSANLTFNGTTLTAVNDASISGLTVGQGKLSGQNNTALGFAALASATTNGNNIAIGYQALTATTTGFQNIAVGVIALAGNTTGGSNIGIGLYALYSNTTGNGSVAVGTQALQSSTTADSNVAVGTQALQSSTTGAANVSIGFQAGKGLTTGSNNTYIGYTATQSGVAVTGEIVIGAGITGKGSNTAFIGGTSGAYNGANSLNWSITSDARIKKNIVSLGSALSIIEGLRPVEFDYIANDKHDIGFIAQEYQTVLPNQIFEAADGMLSLNQNLVPYIVKAIQELKTEIDHLKRA